MRKLALAVLVLLFAAAAFAGDARVRVTLKPEVVDIDAAARELAATYAAKLVRIEDGNVILELSIARSGLVARDPHVAAVTVLGSVDAAPVSRPAALRPSAVLTPRANNTCTPPGLPCSTGTYEYDGSGNIKRIGNDVFVYDELNRLKTATLPSAGGVGETYIYDGFGNMQSVTATPAEGRPDVATNKATNHLSEAGYDGAGNVTAVQISSPRVSALSEREPDFAIFRIRPPSKVRCCPDCSRGECQSWVGCCPNYGSASWTGAEGTSGGENGSLSQVQRSRYVNRLKRSKATRFESDQPNWALSWR